MSFNSTVKPSACTVKKRQCGVQSEAVVSKEATLVSKAQLQAEWPDLNYVQKGLRTAINYFGPDIVGEVVTTKTTRKPLPKGNHLVVQAHPSHVDAIPSVLEGGQVIAYNFPPWHPFGVAIRGVGGLRTGNGCAGTVDTASRYLRNGEKRKLWMAPMGKIHTKSMLTLASEGKVPSGAAAIGLKSGVPIVVEAIDPQAANTNDKRLMTIAGVAGRVGMVVGSVLALLAGRRSGGDSKAKVVFHTLGTALIAVPTMYAVSLLSGLKLAPAPQRLQRVISDVVQPQQIENLSSTNQDHQAAKAQLQTKIFESCDKAVEQVKTIAKKTA